MSKKVFYLFADTQDVKLTYAALEYLRDDMILFYRYPDHVVVQLDKKWEKLDSGELDYCFVEWDEPSTIQPKKRISIKRHPPCTR